MPIECYMTECPYHSIHYLSDNGPFCDEEECRFQAKPTIVCLCGSTRFKEAYIKAMREETLKGHIVVSVGLFGHYEGLDMKGETKKMLDALHLSKINLADEVLFLNVGGYIGESTSRELAFARRRNKTIRFLEGDG